MDKNEIDDIIESVDRETNGSLSAGSSHLPAETGSKSDKPAVGKSVRKATGLAVKAAMIATTVGASFTSPADIVNGGNYLQPTPIVETMDMSPEADDASEDSESEEKKTHRGIRDILRQFLLGLPLGLRAVLVLPVYCIGWVLLQIFGMIGGAVLPVLAHTILGWLLLAAVVLGSVALLLKTIFPDIPLKEMLTPKRIGGILIGVAGVYLLCALLSAVSAEAAKWIAWIKAIGGLGVASLAVYRINKAIEKRRQKAAES